MNFAVRLQFVIEKFHNDYYRFLQLCIPSQIVLVCKGCGIALYPLPCNTAEVEFYVMPTLEPLFENLDAHCLLSKPRFEQFMFVGE